MKTFKQIQEVLKKSDDISVWISDFVKSDDPKFAGKSKDERIKMAKGAYYGAQKEGVIQPNGTDKVKVAESLKDTCWKGYEAIGTKKKNGKEVPNCVPVKEATDLKDVPFDPDPPKKNPSAKAGKHGLGHSIAKHLAKQALKKLTKEEVDLEEAKDTVEKDAAGKVKSWSHEGDWKKSKGTNGQGKVANLSDKARRATEKLTKEETLDEISKETLGSYVHKSFAAGNELHKQIEKETDPVKKAELKAKLSKRNVGVIKAAKKIKEGVSMLSFDEFMKEQKACKKEELHPNQKKLDKNKNGKIDSHDFKLLRKEESELDEATSPMQKLRDAHDRHMEKALAANKAGDDEKTKVHQKYMQKISDKMNKLKRNEEVDFAEVEELCELSKGTLANYTQKAAHDVGNKMYGASSKRAMAVHHDSKGNEKVADYYNKYAAKDHSKALTRLQGIKTAAKKLAKEDVEHLAEADLAAIRAEYKKNESDNKHTENAVLLAKHFGSKSDQNKVAKAKAHRDEHRGYGADPLGRHHAKLSHEVHSKLYHHIKEEVEQIDELDKKTLGSYVKKSHDQLMKHTGTVNMKYGRGDKDATAYALDKDALRKTANRTKGMNQAINKLAKEDTMLTFKELMNNISESAIDDLKDRMAARKATQSAYDKDYKPASKSNVQKVKGHSYGAGEDDGEEEDDNNKKLSKPAAPEVKRGRGRPSGSKSGARR